MVKFYRKKLKNGVVVLFEQRKGCGVVSVAFATRYGGINEGVDEKGIAHFIEHLLYKGTSKRTAKQISEDIEKKGGVLNGFTSEQITSYWCKIPSKHLNTALDVISDLVKNPIFDEKEIEKERKVIFEEIKLYQDNPNLHIHDRIISTLYKGTLGMSLIGTPQTLNKMKREDLIKKFQEVYGTENLILCVVGDTDFNKLCKFTEDNFEKTKAKLPKQKIILQNKKVIEKRRGINQSNLVFAYHTPKVADKKHYAAQALNALMAGGMSSRLFEEIREKRNLAYNVKGNCNSDKDFSYNAIYVGTKKENLALVKKIILQEFGKIKNLKEKELNEIKEQLIGNHQISNEDSQGQMLELLYGEIFENPRQSYDYEKNISKVKLEDVKQIARNALKSYSTFELVPA